MPRPLGHSIDRLLVEILAVPFWFNPVIYLYARSLAHLHELEVDAHMAVQFDRRDYARLLLRLAQVNGPLPVSAFSRQPLHDRISQLFYTKTSLAMKKLLYLLAIPATVLMLWACQREFLRADEVNLPVGDVWVIDHPERMNYVMATEWEFNKEKTKVVGGKMLSKRGSEIDRILVERRESFKHGNREHMIGYITLETPEKVYRFPINQSELNHLIIEWTVANAKQLVSRITLKNESWPTSYAFADGDFDCLVFKHYNSERYSGSQQINVAKGKSPVYKLDDREVSEAELNGMSREEIARIRTIGIDEGHVAALEYGVRGINEKVFFSTKFTGGATAKRLPQPIKP